MRNGLGTQANNRAPSVVIDLSKSIGGGVGLSAHSHKGSVVYHDDDEDEIESVIHNE